ncbi:glycoside hydrolase family 28 protein [Pinibacter aurantiacus]|uniref:Glycoside hydrolase family 28 protein n=1 Tax=Pinibacter aurantiacus TaxID=2851599 RepID=A0A9E2S7Z8_9BACT|nr:glycoside hydrolase family 28 protein [Pinibacter aurantiacus]MBV4357297.1 glycoside hydrolase family 28 protein [Pinibacter aurantiacus]
MKWNIKLSLIVCLSTCVANVLRAQDKTPYSWSNLPPINKPVFKNDTISIFATGAKPDGITLNTVSINRAIEKISEQGGGVVLIPNGVWLTGPIQLKNNVNLHLERAALLQFTSDKTLYPLVKANFEGKETVRNLAPITGTDLINVAITGDGVIDGNGEAWRSVKKDKMTEPEWQKLIASGGIIGADGKTWYPSSGYLLGEKQKDEPKKDSTDFTAIKDFLRPNLLVLTNCKNVLLQNATFQNSPAWGLHIILSENVTMENLNVRNLPSAQNGDGIDIESSAYVAVQNCTIDCGDDGICLKSGKDEEGRKRGKPSQFIIIRNNIVYHAHGGFVIGSEMSGGAHDIFVEDCIFIGTDIGLRFKTARGRGGIVENVYIRNINMHGIVNDAILFDMYYFSKAKSLAETNGKVDIPATDEGTPQFRNFSVSNIICEGANRAILIRGLPEMSIENITLDNITIKSKKGADIIEARNIKMHDIVLSCDHNGPLFNIENSKDLVFDSIKAIITPEIFFSINGDRTGDIKVEQTNLKPIKKNVLFNYGADQSKFFIL